MGTEFGKIVVQGMEQTQKNLMCKFFHTPYLTSHLIKNHHPCISVVVRLKLESVVNGSEPLSSESDLIVSPSASSLITSILRRSTFSRSLTVGHQLS